MKKYIIFLLGLLLFSCQPEKKKTEDTLNEEIATPSETEESPILGERIKGPAEVRDTINGKLLFTLYDNALIETAPKENDWYEIGLFPNNPESDYENDYLKKGIKIMVDGKIIGETQNPVEITLGIIGYTNQKNIQPKSIIENAFVSYFNESKSRDYSDYKSFITNFNLEHDNQFEDLVVYYKNENWMEDPSPMIRFGLVFQKNKLVAILHSRPITVATTTDHKLDRAFDCLVFDDVTNADAIVKTFNHFVNSVD
ncbi:hypothetical protein [Flavobacterium sp. J27]|uniref:hypothetical protein n=1 Tax=Flavobacterium sp. J27 TaxID=2060419 RepID=UPI0010315C1B|nr:hypothetical protein [Flavobacterium sp. J27]